MENEVVKITDDSYRRVNVDMWRRFPDQPEWHVSVTFGDNGYECDPGVYMEPVSTALEEIDNAIAELTRAKAEIERWRDE